MILLVNGKDTYFDWMLMSPFYAAPQLLTYDFDGDGTKDLGVILKTGGGSGVSVGELHILKSIEAPGYDTVDYLLTAEAAWEMMSEIPLTAELADDHNTFIFGVFGERYEIDCSGYNDSRSGTLTGVMHDHLNVNFTFEDNRIKVAVAVGAKYENIAPLQDFGSVSAYVVFDGENFSLEEPVFSILEY